MSGNRQTGSQQSTSTTTSSIPSYLAPYARQSLNAAQQQFNTGGPQAYQGSTVAPFSRQQQTALNNAMRYSNYAQNYGYRGYEMAGQQLGNLSNLARGNFSGDAISQNALGQNRAMTNLSRGDFSNDYIGKNALGTSQAMTALARGDFSNAPQAFKDNLRQNQEDAAYQINNAMSASGIYGTATHQGEVARRIAQATNDAKLNYQRYANQANNQALNAMQNRQAWADQSRRQSLGDIAGRQQWANTAAQRYMALQGQNYQTMMQPYQTQMQVGNAYQNQGQRQINDRLRVYNANQTRAQNNLATYNALLSGAGQLARNQQTTTNASQSRPRNYGSIFGNAASGYVASGFNPFGAAAGALSGLFNT